MGRKSKNNSNSSNTNTSTKTGSTNARPPKADQDVKYNNSTVGRNDVRDAVWSGYNYQPYDASTLNRDFSTKSVDTIMEHQGTGKTEYGIPYLGNSKKSAMSSFDYNGGVTDYIPKLESYDTGDAAIDELGFRSNEINSLITDNKKKVKKEKQDAQELTSYEDDEVIDDWLSTDRKLTTYEKKQAKKVLEDYDKLNVNTNFTDDEETKRKAEQMSALRDKVSNETKVYGSMAGVGGVDALMTLGDTQYKGWTNEDLANEIEIKKPTITNEQSKRVAEIDKAIADLQSQLDKGSGATGDVGVDEAMGLLGQNTAQQSASIREQIENLTREKYITILGKQYDDTYGYKNRKANAQTQDPVGYMGAELGTMAAETMALQGALGNTGYEEALQNILGDSTGGKIATDILKDMPVDVLTDTLPELMSNKANGMTDTEASNQAIKNIALNLGINAGVAGLQNLDEIKQAIRTTLPEKVASGEITEDVAKKVDDTINAISTPELSKESYYDKKIGIRDNGKLYHFEQLGFEDYGSVQTDVETAKQFRQQLIDRLDSVPEEEKEDIIGQIDAYSRWINRETGTNEFEPYLENQVDTVLGNNDLVDDITPEKVEPQTTNDVPTPEEIAELEAEMSFDKPVNTSAIPEVEKIPEDVVNAPTNDIPMVEAPLTDSLDNTKASHISNEINTGKTDISKLRTNTVERDAISDAETKGQIKKELFTYAKSEEKASLEQAANNLEYFDECETRYLNDFNVKNNYNEVDVDTMMGMYQQYCNELRAARNAGDTTTQKLLQSKINKILKNVQEMETKAGQKIQALAKYTRTPDGLVFHARKLANETLDKVKADNPRFAKAVDKATNDLRMKLNLQFVGDDMSSEEMWDEWFETTKQFVKDEADDTARTFEQRLQDRVNGIVDEWYDGITDKKIKKHFSNELENLKGSMTEALADQQRGEIEALMDTFDEIGITGFDSNIDDSVREQIERIFDEMEGLGLDSKQRVSKENEAYSIIANAINLEGSFGEKLNTWRYFAMLSNPKTHIRNFLGNTLFGGMTSIKDAIASVMEGTVDTVSKMAGGEGIERTKSVLGMSQSDRELVKASKENADEIYRLLVDGNKYYGTEAGIEGNKTIFKNKVLDKITGLNSDLLNKEDEFALYQKYKKSLAGYLKANGADASIFKATDDASLELLAKAQNYAIDEAKKATFHQMSNTAQNISKFTRDLLQSESPGKKLFGALIEGAAPFKKTPINIVKSIAAYSPLEVVTLAQDIPKLAKGKINAATFIDDLAKGLTGSMMLYGGFQLAQAGFIHGSDDSQGNQQYSLDLHNIADVIEDKFGVKMPNGGTYTLSGFAPASVPFLVGASLYELATGTEDEKTASFLNALSTITDPVVETTMLQGIADLLSSGNSQDDDSSKLVKAMSTMGADFVSQFVPTELGNIARAVDDTRRSTYTGKTGVPNTFGKAGNSIKNKIPFLSNGAVGDLAENVLGKDTVQDIRDKDIPVLSNALTESQPYVNEWGENEKNVGGNFLGRLAYQHLSPGYYEETDESPRAIETNRIANLYGEEYKNDGVSTTVTVNNEKRKLTPEELTTYSTEAGQAKAKIVDALISSESYKSSTDEQKAEMLKNAYSLGNEVGKTKLFDDYSSSNDNVYDYLDGNIDSVVNSLAEKTWSDTEKATLKKEGLPVNDAVRQAYNSNDTATLNKWKAVQSIAQERNKSDANETLVKLYTREGEKGVNAYFDAKEKLLDKYGIDSSSEKLINAVLDNDTAYISSYKAIEPHTEKFGLPLNDTTMGIYKDNGDIGLRKYSEAKDIVENEYGENMTKKLYEVYYEEGKSGLKEYIDVSNTLDEYGLSYTQSTSDLYYNMGERGLDIYTDIMDNPNPYTTEHSNDSYANLIPYLQNSGLSDSECGELIFSIKDSSKATQKYFDNEDFSGLYKYYLKKYGK